MIKSIKKGFGFTIGSILGVVTLQLAGETLLKWLKNRTPDKEEAKSED